MTISASPLAYVQNDSDGGSHGGTISLKKPGLAKCMTPAKRTNSPMTAPIRFQKSLLSTCRTYQPCAGAQPGRRIVRVTIFLRVVPVIVTVATHVERVDVLTMVVPDTRQTFAYLDETETVVFAPAGALMRMRSIADLAVIRDAVDTRVFE